MTEVFAQQTQPKNFDAEINAVGAAKTAAGFEFLGTLRELVVAAKRRREPNRRRAGILQRSSKAPARVLGLPNLPRSSITFTSLAASFIPPGRSRP
jgi:hypothetical protein